MTLEPSNATPAARLAISITMGFFGVLVLLLFVDIQPTMRDPILLMIGALITSFTGVVAYYFGTTQANSKKDDTIKTLSQTAAVATDTAQAQVAAATPAPPTPSAHVEKMTVEATGATINIEKDPKP